MKAPVLLLPLMPLYSAVVRTRAFAYRRGIFHARRLDVPVISVGNLTFGGTGKTPTVIALTRDLIERGRRPAVLTRGYGRTGRRPAVLVGPEPGAPAAAAGDEPVEIARRLPGVPVVVDPDRHRGGSEAIRHGADVVILDDGFQHLQLARDLDLVLIDAADPWGGGHLPPLGRLREPRTALGRASAVIVTKLDRSGTGLEAIASKVGRLAPQVPVLGARLEPVRWVTPEGERPLEAGRGRRVFAFAGIGRPTAFAETLERLGSIVTGTRWFPDHYLYQPEDLRQILEEAHGRGATPVTTAKDAVKLPKTVGVWVLEVQITPLGGGWEPLWTLIPEVVR